LNGWGTLESARDAGIAQLEPSGNAGLFRVRMPALLLRIIAEQYSLIPDAAFLSHLTPIESKSFEG
jgi:hypothetical protein